MTTAELATRILSQLGFSTAVTMEPSADYRRDKIVKLIDEQKAQWRREVLKQVLRLESPDEYDYMVVLSSDIRRMAEQPESKS